MFGLGTHISVESKNSSKFWRGNYLWRFSSHFLQYFRLVSGDRSFGSTSRTIAFQRSIIGAIDSCHELSLGIEYVTKCAGCAVVSINISPHLTYSWWHLRRVHHEPACYLAASLVSESWMRHVSARVPWRCQSRSTSRRVASQADIGKRSTVLSMFL